MGYCCIPPKDRSLETCGQRRKGGRNIVRRNLRMTHVEVEVTSSVLQFYILHPSVFIPNRSIGEMLFNSCKQEIMNGLISGHHAFSKQPVVTSGPVG